MNHFVRLALAVSMMFSTASATSLKFTSGFESTRQAFAPSGLVLVDVDMDGVLDAVTTNGTETGSPHSMSVRRGLGNGTFGPAADYTTAFFPLAVATGDLNADTWPDIVTANRGSSSVSVFLNRGDGTFFPRVNYAVGSGPRSIAIGDLDGDSHLDLIVANSSAGTISTLRGDGSGLFAPKVDQTSGPSVRALKLIDWDHNGTLDVVAAGYGSNQIFVHLGNGDGSLAPALSFTQPAAPLALDVADIDGDTRPDLLVAWTGATNVSTFLQLPDGTLAPPTDFAVPGGPTDVALRDVTNDGKLDLVVVDWSQSLRADDLSIFAGDGAGGFGPRQSFTTGGKPGLLAIGNVDLAEGADIVVGCTGTPALAIHRANASGSFGSKRPFAPHAAVGQVRVADLDEDGKPDLIASGAGLLDWWRGFGDGTFAAPQPYVLAGAGTGALEVADMNGDGHLDVITPDGPNNNNVRFTYGTGTGTFSWNQSIPTSYAMTSFVLVDLDHDGRMDLVAGSEYSESNLLVRRQVAPNTWTFQNLNFRPGGNNTYAYAVSVGDLNGDGWPDIVSGFIEGIAVTLATGSGNFGSTFLVPGTNTLSGRRVLLGDFDGDGKMDFVASSAGTAIQLWRGDGTGGFTPGGTFPTAGGNTNLIEAADFDLDGNVDLAIAGGNGPPGAPNVVSILRGHGNGTFDGHLDFGVDFAPTAVAVGDFNGDGWPDLAASSQPITILDNLLAPVVAVSPAIASPVARLALSPPAPNPTRGALRYALTLPSPGRLDVHVFDVAGRMVAGESHPGLAAGPQTLGFDAVHLPAGLYFLRVSLGAQSATTRFVVTE